MGAGVAASIPRRPGGNRLTSAMLQDLFEPASAPTSTGRLLLDLLTRFDLDRWLNQISDNAWIQNGVLIGFFVIAALVVDFVINRIFRYWVGHTETDLDDRFVALLHRPVLGSVIALGVWVAILRMEPWTTLRVFLGRLILTVLLWFWASFVLRAGLLLVEALSRLQHRKPFIEPRMLPLAATLHRIAIVAIAGYAFLRIWGIDVGPALAGAGILGIALGFAAKDTLSNLFSGIFIMADAPYESGDYIVLDTGERGEVTKIGLRSTRLLTRDDIEITIPNAVIANAKILNESGGPEVWERVRADVQVAYDSDLDRVRDVLKEIAEQSSYLQAEPSPRVRVRGFADSGIQLQLMGWIQHPELRGRALDSIYREIHRRFSEEGITIPFPTRQILMPEEAPATDLS